jgi:transcriptional/translational regulatory protein YebC/TACO1
VVVPDSQADEDTLMELALEAGADDVRRDAHNLEIICDPETYSDLTAALESADIQPTVAEITRMPNNTIDLDVDGGRKILRLLEALDDHDDVQSVSANFNIPDAAMAELEKEN